VSTAASRIAPWVTVRGVPNLGVLGDDADVGGQRHRDADAHGAAVDGRDDGLAHAVDRQGDLPATVAVACAARHGQRRRRGSRVNGRADRLRG